jgi:alpha-D-xyloside xylohydrolase
LITLRRLHAQKPSQGYDYMGEKTRMSYTAPLLPYTLFPSIPPELPVRQADDQEGPEYVSKVSEMVKHERGMMFRGTTQTGKTVSLTVNIVAPGIVRVLLQGEDSESERVTLARDLSNHAVHVSVETSDTQATLRSDLISVYINYDPFHLQFSGPDGNIFLEQDRGTTNVTDQIAVLPFGFSAIKGQRVAFHDSFTVEPDEHFYGFGEQFTGFDKRGQRLVMWNVDAYGAHSEHAYKNVPFFVSTKGYGIFVDSLAGPHFDMANSNHAVFSLVVPDNALDYYVIAGLDLKSVIQRYTSLVSFPILPPKWAFGLWMSSGFKEETAAEAIQRARQIRAHNIPCDVLHIDCYWQRWGRWSEMIWDKENYPDPAGMIRELKAMGFKVCLWINSYIGIESERFTEAKEQGYFLKTPQGDVYVLPLWNWYHPPVGIVDFTNPAAVRWFKELLRPLLRMGVDVFKTDFGEGVPADAVAYNGMTGVQLHNYYTLLYNDVVAEVTREETQRAGLVWGRSTYTGGQRHAAQWSGDPNCTYSALASTLRGGLSMAMCGHAFWSHDVGGFHGRPTPEVFVRWTQFGMFSPLCRAHGTTTRLPWDYGEDALRIFRDYARLRYRLLPYLYTYASLAAKTGLPILRPIVLEFPDDPHTYTMDLQYMFGSELLVAPIYNSSGHRPVYLPGGKWIDFYTHEVITGPQTRFIDAPLDVLPLYVRANALIPTIEPTEYVSDVPFNLVIFDAYLLNSVGSFVLRDTDGVTELSAVYEGSLLRFQLSGAKKRLGIRVIPLAGTPVVNQIQVNGVPLSHVENLKIGRHVPSGWTRAVDGTLIVLINEE